MQFNIKNVMIVGVLFQLLALAFFSWKSVVFIFVMMSYLLYVMSRYERGSRRML